MGQGNCQLAVYEKERIGILYDCGSSSWKTCTKLSALHAEKYELFFQKKDKAGSPNKTSGQPAPLDVFSILEEEGNTPEEILSDGSVGSSFSQDDKSDIDDIDLNSILKKLNHVFIILSHPDRDHINLVNTENIPDGIPMTFLCEGDWFGQKNKKGDRLTEDVCAVLPNKMCPENPMFRNPICAFSSNSTNALSYTLAENPIFNNKFFVCVDPLGYKGISANIDCAICLAEELAKKSVSPWLCGVFRYSNRVGQILMPMTMPCDAFSFSYKIAIVPPRPPASSEPLIRVTMPSPPENMFTFKFFTLTTE